MPNRLADGQLRAAISNAMVRIMHEFYGRGPRRAKTYMFDNYIFCVLDDVLTTVETTLHDAGEEDLVRELRLTFEDLMTKVFVAEVEQITGRRVVGYHSQIVFDPDFTLEVFVLEPSAEAASDDRNTERPDIESAQLERPGRVGDADALGSTDESVIAGPDVAATPTDRRSTPAAGSREAAISNAMVRVTHELYGHGAARAKTYIADNYIFCAMEEPLTRLERTLIEGGQGGMVRRVRLRYQSIKHRAYDDEIEQIARRQVLSSHSQVVFDPDVLLHMFVLAPTEGA